MLLRFVGVRITRAIKKGVGVIVFGSSVYLATAPSARASVIAWAFTPNSSITVNGFTETITGSFQFDTSNNTLPQISMNFAGGLLNQTYAFSDCGNPAFACGPVGIGAAASSANATSGLLAGLHFQSAINVSSNTPMINGGTVMMANGTLYDALSFTGGLTQALAPAPVPGAGPLSYLALAVGILLYKRKMLFGMAKTFAGRLSGKASAQASSPKPARAEPDQRCK